MAKSAKVNAPARMVRDIRSHADALRWFGDATGTRKLGNNTTITREGIGASNDAFVVRLHGHAIVTYLPDAVVLSSRGYRTVTTKGRLNSLIPVGFGVGQRKGKWYVRDARTGREVEFFDGIVLRDLPGGMLAEGDVVPTKARAVRTNPHSKVTPGLGVVVELVAYEMQPSMTEHASRSEVYTGDGLSVRKAYARLREYGLLGVEGAAVRRVSDSQLALWGKLKKTSYKTAESYQARVLGSPEDIAALTEATDGDRGMRRNPAGGEGHNGWKNKATWNVALWIGNDESLYNYAKTFQKYRNPYSAFARAMTESGDVRTPDGFKWHSRLLDYKALNAFVREL